MHRLYVFVVFVLLCWEVEKCASKTGPLVKTEITFVRICTTVSATQTQCTVKTHPLYVGYLPGKGTQFILQLIPGGMEPQDTIADRNISVLSSLEFSLFEHSSTYEGYENIDVSYVDTQTTQAGSIVSQSGFYMDYLFTPTSRSVASFVHQRGETSVLLPLSIWQLSVSNYTMQMCNDRIVVWTDAYEAERDICIIYKDRNDIIHSGVCHSAYGPFVNQLWTAPQLEEAFLICNVTGSITIKNKIGTTHINVTYGLLFDTKTTLISSDLKDSLNNKMEGSFIMLSASGHVLRHGDLQQTYPMTTSHKRLPYFVFDDNLPPSTILLSVVPDYEDGAFEGLSVRWNGTYMHIQPSWDNNKSNAMLLMAVFSVLVVLFGCALYLDDQPWVSFLAICVFGSVAVYSIWFSNHTLSDLVLRTSDGNEFINGNLVDFGAFAMVFLVITQFVIEELQSKRAAFQSNHLLATMTVFSVAFTYVILSLSYIHIIVVFSAIVGCMIIYVVYTQIVFYVTYRSIRDGPSVASVVLAVVTGLLAIWFTYYVLIGPLLMQSPQLRGLWELYSLIVALAIILCSTVYERIIKVVHE